MSNQLALGLDFGTESVRAVLVDLSGDERAAASMNYPHGQITKTLPGSDQALEPLFAFQHPGDWIASSAQAVRSAMQQAGATADDIVGIGVDFTSCTMLPALRDGTPLCMADGFADRPMAWPKLWKHHGAQKQTDRINEVARQRKEAWLDRYGGIVGLEWFFPKIYETLERDQAVYDAAEVWVEGGDWLVWQLVGGEADDLPRSTCQAGYKAMWSAEDGYPSRDFLAAVDARLADVAETKMPGRMVAPGQQAGGLCAAMAEAFGLREGTPVSAAIIDAHAGVPGVGAGDAGALVMVMGTSSCHMLNAVEQKAAPGVAGIVRDGILPGYYGYETGQAAVGDAFDWIRRMLGVDDFAKLDEAAAAIEPGSDGVTCVDWFNGCRTPLMDGALRGGYTGLSLHHGPAHVYRATLEASAYGVRWIVELLREHGVPVDRFVATGGLPHHNPLLVQIYADVLGAPIEIPNTTQGPALGAAILGAIAAGPDATGFADSAVAVAAMTARITGEHARIVQPDMARHADYETHYTRYRRTAAMLQRDTEG
ncbi:ribulokinase [Planctomycetales bacterium ZRK34]|nr:ribulokinase [Planctomycetales bacterium ZRK34]